MRHPATPESTRAPRADSTRNRAAILTAARDQITAHGPDVGMVEIAAAAGVAVGTLYRHFPTKGHLVASVIGEFVTGVADEAERMAERVRAGASARDELVRFLSGVVEGAATNQAVKTAAAHLDADIADSDNEQRAAAALQSVIDVARQEGHVLADLTVDDVYLLVSTVPSTTSTTVRERWLHLVMNGIMTSS